MAINLQSPGVQVIEKDASSVTPGASTTVGGTVGNFHWGPVMQPMLISSENELVSIFGKPTDTNYDSFYAAANFLSYTNALYVTRYAQHTASEVGAFCNATSEGGSGVRINNISDFETSASTDRLFIARYPGAAGNSIKVSIADAGTFATWAYKDLFQAAPGTSDYTASKNGSNDELHVVVIDIDGVFGGTPGDVLEKYSFLSKATDGVSNTGISNFYKNVINYTSQYVYAGTTLPSGITNWEQTAANTVFQSLVDAVGTAKTITGASNTGGTATLTFAVQLVKPFVVGQSVTVSGMTPVNYNGTFVVTASTKSSVSYEVTGTFGVGTVFGSVVDSSASTKYDFTYELTSGLDEDNIVNGDIQLAWDLYKDVETYDISLFFVGNVDHVVSKYVVDNIGEVRRDCVVFVSMCQNDGSPIMSTSATKLTDATAFKTAMGNSTYAVFDSGFKYQYDKYNDKYRWIALNSDTAGLCAKVDQTQETWFSPAGLTKGQIRGVVKLSWNPNQTERDHLYKLAINPVVTFAGQGTLLYGDKTGTLKPSAFDRINVRRLFLVLEKSISRSARYQLFEINDSITRQQFISSIEPFLRDVQGRRGIDAFKIVCDETNNTPQVVQTNEFRASILIRPLYSINFITLTFTALNKEVSFETAVLA